MTTIADSSWQINGVLSTDKTVWQNMQTLASASSCFITFDTAGGKWNVVINRAETSVKSFDDSNIIGSIVISGSGLSDMYNAVQIEFPHKDMMDNRDTILDQIPIEDYYPNEPTKLLNLTYDIINDPVQAEMISLMELKQSRLDKIIQFRTDFTSIGLRAGDVIDVTSEMYAFDSKLFRIISIEEADEADGSIVLSITGLEYDDNVYDFSDVARYHRDTNTGVPSSSVNQAIQESNKASGGAQVITLSISPYDLTNAFNTFTGGGVTITTVPAGDQVVTNWAPDAPLGAGGIGLLLAYFYVPSPINCLSFILQNPVGQFDYMFASPVNASLVPRTGTVAYLPMQVDLQYKGEDGSASARTLQTNTADWQTQSMNFQLLDVPVGVYRFIIRPLITYDFNQKLLNKIFPYNYSVWPNSNGDAITINGYSFYK